ncbi:hypothetical protein R83H12_02649 [Fibrobacteria bacterium R8-3-H12]
MKNNFSKITLAAILGFALAFTFSCSSDDGGGGNTKHTYYYSYGVIDAQAINVVISNIPRNPTFEDVRTAWSEIKQYGVFLESKNGMSESEGRNLLIERDVAPGDIDNILKDLKARGNTLISYSPKPYSTVYNAGIRTLIAYIEQE